jgi:sucrose-phosphate phosphatase subfamily
MKSRKKFKAIICDIDGTLTLNKKDALPSKRVIEAVKKASKRIHFGVATSRPLHNAEKLIEILNLSTPCIVSSGTQIYDPVSKTFCWEKYLESKHIKRTGRIAKKFGERIIALTGTNEVYFDELKSEKVINFWFHSLAKEKAEKIEAELLKITGIYIHKIESWRNGLKDFVISDDKATKEHAVKKVAKILGISTDEIIVVGDGHNDIPLFKSAGLKVAMGNADEELKAIADYVAPSVEEDGIVDIIEKFIL